jgi:hypothetical protein
MPKNILKRLTSIENTLLCESRKKRVIQKYPWFTHTEDYKYDPSYTRPISFFTIDDPSPKKDNKYLEWLADQYAIHINKYIKKSTEDYKEKWSFNDKDREQWLELAKTTSKDEEWVKERIADWEEARNTMLDSLKRKQFSFIQSSIYRSGSINAASLDDPEKIRGFEDNPGVGYNYLPAYLIYVVERFVEYLPHIKNKDIGSYKNYRDLEKVISVAEDKALSAQAAKEKIRGDAKEIFSSEETRVKIRRPMTEAASIFYGQGTQWCISASKSECYFNSYSYENNHSFYMISMPYIDVLKESSYAPNQWNKICLVCDDKRRLDSIFLADDRQIRERDFTESWDLFGDAYYELGYKPGSWPTADEIIHRCIADATLDPPIQGMSLDEVEETIQKNGSRQLIFNDFGVDTAGGWGSPILSGPADEINLRERVYSLEPEKFTLYVGMKNETKIAFKNLKSTLTKIAYSTGARDLLSYDGHNIVKAWTRPKVMKIAWNIIKDHEVFDDAFRGASDKDLLPQGVDFEPGVDLESGDEKDQPPYFKVPIHLKSASGQLSKAKTIFKTKEELLAKINEKIKIEDQFFKKIGVSIDRERLATAGRSNLRSEIEGIKKAAASILAKDEKYMVGDNIVPWPVKNKSDYSEYLEFLKEFPTILATVKFDFENSWENMLLKSGVFNEEQIALFANKGDINNED